MTKLVFLPLYAFLLLFLVKRRNRKKLVENSSHPRVIDLSNVATNIETHLCLARQCLDCLVIVTLQNWVDFSVFFSTPWTNRVRILCLTNVSGSAVGGWYNDTSPGIKSIYLENSVSCVHNVFRFLANACPAVSSLALCGVNKKTECNTDILPDDIGYLMPGKLVDLYIQFNPFENRLQA